MGNLKGEKERLENIKHCLINYNEISGDDICWMIKTIEDKQNKEEEDITEGILEGIDKWAKIYEETEKENKRLKEEIERMKEEKHYDDLQAKADGAHEDWLDSKEERDY